jgi:hypothetical protein
VVGSLVCVFGVGCVLSIHRYRRWDLVYRCRSVARFDGGVRSGFSVRVLHVDGVADTGDGAHREDNLKK